MKPCFEKDFLIFAISTTYSQLTNGASDVLSIPTRKLITAEVGVTNFWPNYAANIQNSLSTGIINSQIVIHVGKKDTLNPVHKKSIKI